MTNSELKIQFQKSPQQCHRMIVDEYSNYVYTIVFSQLRNAAGREDIEDCVSNIFAEVFFSLSKNADSYSDLKLLVGTIAKRTAIDAYRKLIRDKNILSDEKELENIQSDQSVAETAERSQRRQKLLDIVHELGEPDCTIIIYQYFFDRSISEIAQKFSMTVSAVRKRSERARKRLRSVLDDDSI